MSDVIADIQSVSYRYVTSPISIVVNYPETLLPGAKAAWQERTGTIYIRSDQTDLDGLSAHEAYHAVSQSPDGKVEHGLVYAMTALRGYDHWHYMGNSVTSTTSTYDTDGRHTANMMYRIAQEVGVDKAYQFVLEVDKLAPSSIYGLVSAMKSVSNDLGISTQVNEVLVAVGEITPPAPVTPVPVDPLVVGEVYLYSDFACRNYLSTEYVSGHTIDKERFVFLGAGSFTRASSSNVCESVDDPKFIPRRPND